MLRIGEAFVADGDNCIFNGFKKLDLNGVHEVTVPTLVFVKDCTVPEEMFDFNVAPSREKPGQLQIIAKRIGRDACVSQLLRETDSFRLRSGLRLTPAALPGVHAATFGLYGGMPASAIRLWEESISDNETGLIVLK